MIFHNCISPSRMQRPVYCDLHDINLCWYRCEFHCGISLAVKTVCPCSRMSGMGSAVCKAFRVDIAQCELGQIGAVTGRKLAKWRSNDLSLFSTQWTTGALFCFQRIWNSRVQIWGEIQLKCCTHGNEYKHTMWAGLLSRYSGRLRAGRSRDRILVGTRFFAHIQTDPGAHPAYCTMGTGSFPGVKRPGRGADHPPLLAPRTRKSRAIPLLPF
jgi:hypothetical protein